MNICNSCGHTKLIHWLTPTAEHGGCCAIPLDSAGQRCGCKGFQATEPTATEAP